MQLQCLMQKIAGRCHDYIAPLPGHGHEYYLTVKLFLCMITMMCGLITISQSKMFHPNC
jgi:hypothetical protein